MKNLQSHCQRASRWGRVCANWQQPCHGTWSQLTVLVALVSLIEKLPEWSQQKEEQRQEMETEAGQYCLSPWILLCPDFSITSWFQLDFCHLLQRDTWPTCISQESMPVEQCQVHRALAGFIGKVDWRCGFWRLSPTRLPGHWPWQYSVEFCL